MGDRRAGALGQPPRGPGAGARAALRGRGQGPARRRRAGRAPGRRPTPFAAELVAGASAPTRPRSTSCIRALSPGAGRSSACRSSTGPCCAWQSTSWLHRPDVPTGAVISEAVELAKRYSTDDSRPLRQRHAVRDRGRGAARVLKRADPGRSALPDPAAGRRRGRRRRLRPWRATGADVAALVAAWSDPEVGAGVAVPPERPLAAASRGAGSPAGRRPARLADWPSTWSSIAVDDDDPVLGEVGLRNVDRVRRRRPSSAGGSRPAAPGARPLGAPRSRWWPAWAAGPPLRLRQVWARISPANPASAAVARRAGFRRLGAAAGTEIWSRSPEGRPGAASLRP